MSKLGDSEANIISKNNITVIIMIYLYIERYV